MSVSLTFTHNHPVGAADALKYRKVSEETREKFLDLFKAGHDPASALESHRYACLSAYITYLGAFKKKIQKSEITMEVGGWVQVSFGFFLLENRPEIALNQY